MLKAIGTWCLSPTRVSLRRSVSQKPSELECKSRSLHNGSGVATWHAFFQMSARPAERFIFKSESPHFLWREQIASVEDQRSSHRVSNTLPI